MPANVVELLERCSETLVSPWEVSGLAALEALDGVLATANSGLLRSDAQVVQLRWFLEGLIPTNLDERDPTLATAQLVQSTSRHVAVHFHHLGERDRRQLTRILAKIVSELMLREKKERGTPSRSDKRILLDTAGAHPRCYLCGSLFTSDEIARFIGEETYSERLPDPRVDFLFPRGTRSSDGSIVVEHVRPVADGGPSTLDNLRLACRYCNGLKRETLTFYSRSEYGRKIRHPTLGWVVPPNPLWCVRLLALRGRCHECNAGSDTRRLHIAPTRGPSRYLNPIWMAVYCVEHDPLARSRYVPLSLIVS